MIGDEEIDSAARQFGAPKSQVVRDHLISHVLAALADFSATNRVTFFGGTALCRTWLPNLRLSEDIDLLVDSPDVSDEIRSHLSQALRRQFPTLEWTKLGSHHDVETCTLTTEATDLKVQFALWRHGWEDAIKTSKATVALRYSDLPSTTELTVPTPAGFSVMKLLAWLDRAAPRDIYDLAALADAKMIDATALESVRMIAGFTPTSRAITNVPMSRVREEWDNELNHQLNNPKSLDECVALVRDALEAHDVRYDGDRQMSDNPHQANRIETIRDLSTHEFTRSNQPDSARKVGGIASRLLFLASDHATNWELNETIDGGGVHYWETNEGELDVYSTNSVGFTSGRDIVSKATFEDHGDEISASLAIGNVDSETLRASEYPGAVMMPTEDGVMLLTKTLEHISWTDVLHATISADDNIEVRRT